MRNVYVYTKKGGLGKLILYVPEAYFPYAVECYMPKIGGYKGKIYGQEIYNAFPFSKKEIKFLHKKPLRYMIERRQHEKLT